MKADNYPILYRYPITELKKRYIPTVVNLAYSSWKRKNLNMETIIKKGDGLITRLDRANKPEFISILRYYWKEAI